MVEHEWNAALAEHQLTMAGLVALNVLQSGPCSQRELAAHCRVEEQTMSRTVERLERTGHVRRTRDDADRRRTLVEATPHGANTLRAASDAARRVESNVLGAEGTSADFRAALERIVSTRPPS
jgi:DNA-binding MarR family transcriptional regulator